MSYEQNIHSDSSFCKEYLESRSGDENPEILIVDDIPLRGLIRSKMFFAFKVGPYNIRKLIMHLPNVWAKSDKIWFKPKNSRRTRLIYSENSNNKQRNKL